MAMPQRDDLIDAIRCTDALLEWAVVHGEESEAERLREKLRRLAAMGDVCECEELSRAVAISHRQFAEGKFKSNDAVLDDMLAMLQGMRERGEAR